MDSKPSRMTDRSHTPSDEEIKAFVGKSSWNYRQTLRKKIDELYPGVFTPDWIYGGAKHGWNLRYKKSKSFCTLIPGAKQTLVQIVFGGDERKKMETQLNTFHPALQRAYADATVYHDGKWLLIDLNSKGMLSDILAMLAIKRKPAKKERTLKNVRSQ